MSAYCQPQSPPSLTSLAQSDSLDGCELKTEFYTREGLWKLVPSGEYLRQPQSIYTQQQQQSQTGLQQNQAGLGPSGPQHMNPGLNGAGLLVSTNEPVKVMSFRYFRFDQVMSARNMSRFKNLCVKCAQKKSLSACRRPKKDAKKASGGPHQAAKVHFSSMPEYDDDDDVVYSGASNGESSESDSDAFVGSVERGFDNCNLGGGLCKHCGGRVSRSNESNSLIVNFSAASMLATTPWLDLVVFNYAREIYFYEANDLKGCKVRATF